MSDEQTRPKPKWKKGQHFWDRRGEGVQVIGDPFWKPSAEHPEGQWWYPIRIVTIYSAKEQALEPIDE